MKILIRIISIFVMVRVYNINCQYVHKLAVDIDQKVKVYITFMFAN